MSRRWWVLVVLAAVVVLLAGAGQVWVEAMADDVVLGTTPVEVTGSAAAPVVTGAALLAGAAVIAALVGSRVVRVAAVVFLLLAAVVGGWATLEVVLDPVAVAEVAAGERTAVRGGAAGTVGEASVTAWAWLALVSCVVVTVCGLAVLLGLLRPRTAAVPGGGTPGARAGRRAGPRPDAARAHPVSEESAWERLSKGEDPTDPGAPPA